MSDHTRWKTRLHLMPPAGWLNDPNGLCQFHGVYHVFFQYRPDDASGNGNTGWGHYSSPDLLHWTFLGMPLKPDRPFDRDGVYSGCALIDGDTMRLFYTGNVKHAGDFDYIYSGREANVALTSSEDGVVFGEKELLLTNDSYPAACTCHVRDPKVWKEGDGYFMVLGARFGQAAAKGDFGGVLLYHSKDCRHWDYINTLTSPDAFGYMWECPDVFVVGSVSLLSVSPQGLTRERFRFQNIYQSGYFTITGDITGSYALSDFREWDFGFDFYAPQTFCDENGRRILIGWMGLPDIQDEYRNSTAEDGWQHILSIPREVFVNKAGAVCQRPVLEFESLRKRQYTIENHKTVQIDAPFDMLVSSDHTKTPPGDMAVTLYDSLRICFSPARGECSMTFLPLSARDDAPQDAIMQPPGYGRSIRRAKICPGTRQIRVICDTSAVEVFFGDGETVMSTRIYPDDDVPATVSVEGGAGVLWEMAGMGFESPKHCAKSKSSRSIG